jgi:hypothetical protein
MASTLGSKLSLTLAPASKRLQWCVNRQDTVKCTEHLEWSECKYKIEVRIVLRSTRWGVCEFSDVVYFSRSKRDVLLLRYHGLWPSWLTAAVKNKVNGFESLEATGAVRGTGS